MFVAVDGEPAFDRLLEETELGWRSTSGGSPRQVTIRSNSSNGSGLEGRPYRRPRRFHRAPHSVDDGNAIRSAEPLEISRRIPQTSEIFIARR